MKPTPFYYPPKRFTVVRKGSGKDQEQWYWLETFDDLSDAEKFAIDYKNAPHSNCEIYIQEINRKVEPQPQPSYWIARI